MTNSPLEEKSIESGAQNNDGAHASSSKLEVRNQSEDASVLAGSPHSGQVPTGNQSSPDRSGARQSPPVQVMGKSDTEDPNRIPSSIFARTNTATPMEWSVASNESLFSIHMGNSSFSRDQAFLVGKSQELAFPNSPLNGTPPLTPARRPVNFEQSGAAEAANAEAMNDVMRATAEGQTDKDRTSEVEPRSTTSTSRRSDGSVCSFAFPILAGEGRDGSIKVGPEPQQGQTEQRTETPKAASRAAENKWFSCLSCCPFCH